MSTVMKWLLQWLFSIVELMTDKDSLTDMKWLIYDP